MSRRNTRGVSGKKKEAASYDTAPFSFKIKYLTLLLSNVIYI